MGALRFSLERTVRNADPVHVHIIPLARVVTCVLAGRFEPKIIEISNFHGPAMKGPREGDVRTYGIARTAMKYDENERRLT